MRVAALCALVVFSAISATAQAARTTPVVLPSDVSEADLRLSLPAGTEPNDPIDIIEPLLGNDGRAVSPQPTVGEVSVNGEVAQIHLAAVHFWGRAVLRVRIGGPNAPLRRYYLQRGPALSTTRIALTRSAEGQIWLYNFGDGPLTARWRVRSGLEMACSPDPGTALRDCTSVAQLPLITIEPGTSEVLKLAVPPHWFHPWSALAKSGDTRYASLELFYGTRGNGTNNDAHLMRSTIRLVYYADLWESVVAQTGRIYYWLPPGLRTAMQTLVNLGWLTLWVTIGAAALMLAQVMVPNFRKALRMDSQVQALQEQFRSLSSNIGNQLMSRCDQEIETLRRSLAMGNSDGFWKSIWSWERIALSGNSEEIRRITALVKHIECRMALTRRLDEYLAAETKARPNNLPPSLAWQRKQQAEIVEGILTKLSLGDADEKAAAGLLDRLANVGFPMEDFAKDLEANIDALRRQFQVEPWKGKVGQYIQNLPGCAALLKDPPDAPPAGGWTATEILLRDLAATRLSLVMQLISIQAIADANPSERDAILKKLESANPAKLGEAKADLLILSEGVKESAITNALRERRWAYVWDPAVPSEGDTVRMRFRFLEQGLNDAAARDSFSCYWRVARTLPGPAPGKEPVKAEDWDRGWEVQFRAKEGKYKVAALIFDRTGARVYPQSEAEVREQALSIPAQVKQAHERAVRGLLDAGITAIIPVITVAIAQFQNGANLGIGELILLGFTSQAIRAAVVPESAIDSSAAANP